MSHASYVAINQVSNVTSQRCRLKQLLTSQSSVAVASRAVHQRSFPITARTHFSKTLQPTFCCAGKELFCSSSSIHHYFLSYFLKVPHAPRLPLFTKKAIANWALLEYVACVETLDMMFRRGYGTAVLALVTASLTTTAYGFNSQSK
jgi:hypothetical protein